MNNEDGTEAGGEFLAADSEAEGGLALYRLSTTALEVETVVQPLLDSETLPTEDDAGNPIHDKYCSDHRSDYLLRCEILRWRRVV